MLLKQQRRLFVQNSESDQNILSVCLPTNNSKAHLQGAKLKICLSMWALNQVNKHDRESFLRDARDFALTNGLVLRYDRLNRDNLVAHCPFTAFPSPYPEKLYKQCIDLQPIINKLLMLIANDSDYLNNILGQVAKADEFTRNLLSIENTVRKEGRAQPIGSCISRSDYMLDKCSGQTTGLAGLKIRQVEMNAIACGMSALGSNAESLHHYLASKYNITNPESTSLPRNESLDLVVSGLIDAFDSYNKASAQILFVTEESSKLFADHFQIEFELGRRRPDIKITRRCFSDLFTNLRLGPNRELLLDGTKEIGVVYFRLCYDPSHYNFENAWETRLLLERSRAIKCPSINFQLAGAKKFQEVLNNREQLERFLTSDESTQLADVFCKFWSIESELDAGYKLATTMGQCNKLVLKPQREGGGHNIYAKDIKPFVEQLKDAQDRNQYVMMEYIDGPCEQNFILRSDDKRDGELARMQSCDQLISELGIFGSILADGNSTILSNRSAGYLVRCKELGVNEGGVGAGYAGVGSLILVKDDVDLSTYFFSR